MNVEAVTDRDAERATIAVCLLHGRSAEALATEEGLRPEHFYWSSNGRTFSTMLALCDEGLGVDLLTVTGRLDRDGGERPERGWRLHLDDITADAVSLAGGREYGRRVIDAWRWERRRLAHLAAMTAVAARDEAALIEAEQQADQLVASEPGEHLHEPEALGAHMLDWLAKPKEAGLPLPWPQLHRMLKLRRGHTTVIAGFTSIGKTIVAGSAAAHAGQHGLRAVMWITEMTREEHAARQITRDTGVSYNALMDGELGPRDAERVVKALGEMPFGVVEAHGWPAEQIARHLRQIRPDLAVVDHFHALPSVAKTADADDAIQALVTGAARADCHLIVVAQLNQARNVGSARPAPVLRDLRGTGNLANLPSNVLLVHRDEEQMEGTDRTAAGELGHLDIAKQRGGQLGVVPVRFDEHRLRFLEEATP